MHISIDRRSNLPTPQLEAMHRLRAQVFRERKQWEVTVISDMEIDGYDALNPYYMLMQKSPNEKSVFGCWRILPTTGPYMLAHTFPELLFGQEAPQSEKIWELSRFALINPQEKSGFRFSKWSVDSIRTIVNFAIKRNVTQFVTVTTLGVEKLLIHLGLDLNRFGPSIRIGSENAIALRIELNEKTCQALKL